MATKYRVFSVGEAPDNGASERFEMAYNEVQQKVVDAWNLMLRTRDQQERTQFGEPQDHPNKEILTPIKEVIALYETEHNFTPKDVVEGLGSWASSWALQVIKNLEEKSYGNPVNGRFLAQMNGLKYCWMDTDE